MDSLEGKQRLDKEQNSFRSTFTMNRSRISCLVPHVFRRNISVNPACGLTSIVLTRPTSRPIVWGGSKLTAVEGASLARFGARLFRELVSRFRKLFSETSFESIQKLTSWNHQSSPFVEKDRKWWFKQPKETPLF